MDLDDSGTYYCSAGNNVLQVDSVNLVVKRTNVSLGYPFKEELQDAPLLALPEPDSSTNSSDTNKTIPAQVSVTPEELTVYVGESAEFKCSVAEERDGVEVYWRRQDSPIALDVVINGTFLSINSVKLSHAGSYYCIFSNELRKSNAKAVLNVREREQAGI